MYIYDKCPENLFIKKIILIDDIKIFECKKNMKFFKRHDEIK